MIQNTKRHPDLGLRNMAPNVAPTRNYFRVKGLHKRTATNYNPADGCEASVHMHNFLPRKLTHLEMIDQLKGGGLSQSQLTASLGLEVPFYTTGDPKP